TVTVEADVFADGHDSLAAVLKYKLLPTTGVPAPQAREGAPKAMEGPNWIETPMTPLVNDRWRGEFPVTDLGRYVFTVEGWVDHYETWSRQLAKRVQAGQDVTIELEAGARMVEEAAARADGRAALLGFDVPYPPPSHPSGKSHRKGANNKPAAPGEPGSPWAIGSQEGGHKAVHPDLGTLEDFRHLVQAAAGQGLDVALDIAFQCSPDHPYTREHPEWFRHRPDGSIQYAENPPKKYEDIYPFDFETEHWRGLWQELLSIVLYWAEQGVSVFRVDNPHTKPFAFWEWLIAELRRAHPEAILLSEAFTRPKVMYRLAKVGFSQSYTYFAWRNTAYELYQYFTELSQPPIRDFFRPNLW